MTLTMTAHKPVLLKETIEYLNVKPNKRYVDCTLGLGGHALGIIELIHPNGQILAIDADRESIKIAMDKLARYSDNIIFVNDNFINLEQIVKKYEFIPVDGVLFDLGVSSYQLDSAERGFSFRIDAKPDMRFGSEQVLTAMDLLNILPEHRLAQLLEEYGEEYKAKQIAKQIVLNRPIVSTIKLASIIERTVGKEKRRIHPATKTFLALRIAINHELENIEKALAQAVKILDHKGRLVVISYHSLEDRIVKQFIKRESSDCICPPGIPVCQCEHVAVIKEVIKKVITPSVDEIRNNPRARSAKLRVVEKI